MITTVHGGYQQYLVTTILVSYPVQGWTRETTEDGTQEVCWYRFQIIIKKLGMKTKKRKILHTTIFRYHLTQKYYLTLIRILSRFIFASVYCSWCPSVSSSPSTTSWSCSCCYCSPLPCPPVYHPTYPLVSYPGPAITCYYSHLPSYYSSYWTGGRNT